jgi:hypothetical protein
MRLLAPPEVTVIDIIAAPAGPKYLQQHSHQDHCISAGKQLLFHA